MGVYFMGIIYLVLIAEFITAAGYDNITTATTAASISSSSAGTATTPASLTPPPSVLATAASSSSSLVNAKPTELFNQPQLNSSITTAQLNQLNATASRSNNTAISSNNSTNGESISHLLIFFNLY